MERMEKYSEQVQKHVPHIHLYQFVIVRDVLGYSRDMGSRNTLWIPDDFTIREFIEYCQQECISDPKLLPLRRIDSFLNPYQPINWYQVSQVEKLDGSYVSRGKNISLKMTTDNEVSQNNNLQRRDIEPIELVKLREKARNTMMKGEEYVDTSDIFSYWNIPNTLQSQSQSQSKKTKTNKKTKKDGRDPNVPEYSMPEESTHVEHRVNYDEQISDIQTKYRDTLKEEQEKRLSMLNQNDRDLLSFELDTGEDDEEIDVSLRRPLSIEYDYVKEQDLNKHTNINDLTIELSQQEHYWDYLDGDKNDPNLKMKEYIESDFGKKNRNIDRDSGELANSGGIINASSDGDASYLDNIVEERDGNASDLDENDSGDDDEEFEIPPDSDGENEEDDDSDGDNDDGEETDYDEYEQIETPPSPTQQTQQQTHRSM